jgi:hypothetical protein
MEFHMKKPLIALVALGAIALTSNAASAVTWNFSGHVTSLAGGGTTASHGEQIGDLVTGFITFNEHATSANLRADSTPTSYVYEDTITYMMVGGALVTDGSIHPDSTVLNIYSNNGLFGDDGFSFGNSFGGSLLVGVMAFFPDAGGSVIQSLALSTIPFDISLFPENNRIIRGLDYDATLEALTLASPVPELATWAMMVLGFAGIGFMSYRRTRLA